MNGNAWIKFTNELSIQMRTALATAVKMRTLYISNLKEHKKGQTNQRWYGKTNAKWEMWIIIVFDAQNVLQIFYILFRIKKKK